LAEPPAVLIAAQPTRGLDVGATQFVHSELLRLRNQNTAILLISADLDELEALSDRFLVIFEGHLVGELTADEATRARLGMPGKVRKMRTQKPSKSQSIQNYRPRGRSRCLQN
jgi:simple sugar transport system ATP-binding protein